jgi:hypothetical protein
MPAAAHLARPRRSNPIGLVLLTAALGWGCSARPSGQEKPGSQATPPGPPASAAPVASRLPKQSLTRSDRAAWQALLRWPDDCDEAFRQSHAGDDAGLEFHQLSDGVFLLGVVCAAGSYQPSTIFLRVDDRKSPPTAVGLTFDSYESADGASLMRTQVTELWGDAAFLAPTRELTLLSVSRQSGDCGTWARYALTEATPRLLEFRARLPCPARPGDHVAPEPGKPPPGWKTVSTQ